MINKRKGVFETNSSSTHSICVSKHDDLYPIGCNYRNLASNCTLWGVFNLGQEIKKGLVSKIDNIHRVTIDQATERKYDIVY